MKYLCLVYYGERIMKDMSQAEWDALNNECIANTDNLVEAGHYIDGAPLLTTEHAATVRVRDGVATTTDGPFAETKEQLAGFYMLEARDRDEVLRLAAKIPPARYGSIEVRPVRELRAQDNTL